MAKVPTTTIRIDPEVKEQASEIFDELGLSLSAAVNIFLRAVVRRKGIVFEACFNLHDMGVKQRFDLHVKIVESGNL